MFRWVRSTWMTPSKAQLKLWMMGGMRRTLIDASSAFAPGHRRAVVVAEQVQQAVDERRPPGVADDLRAEDDVAELARHAGRERIASVDRKGEDVGRLVDPEMLALQLGGSRSGGSS